MDPDQAKVVREIPKTNPPLFFAKGRIGRSTVLFKFFGFTVLPAFVWYEIYRFQTDYEYVSKLKPYKPEVNKGTLKVNLNF